MKKEAYELSKKNYGHCASWAIWALPEVWSGTGSRANMDDVSFFDDDQVHTKLNPNIVLLALNFSKKITFKNKFQNFHSGGKGSGGAYKLRLMLKDTSFWGAYMTDIIKDLPEKDANKAYKIWKNDPVLRRKSLETFDQELKDIGSVNPLIVCFGKNVFEIAQEHLSSKYKKIVEATHYSYRGGKYKPWSDEKSIEEMHKIIEDYERN